MHPALEHIDRPQDISWRYHTMRAPRFGAQWHFHPEIELTLITHGSGTRIVGDSVENYRPGDLTLIGSDLPHSYSSAPGHDEHAAIVIHFRRDFLGPEFLRLPEFAALHGLIDTAARGLNVTAGPELVALLHKLATGPGAERTLGLVRLLGHLAEASELRTLTTAATRHPVNAAGRERADAVHAYLADAHTGPVRLHEAAEVAHLTPTAFSRFFRRTFGRTFTDYVTDLRVATACRLLSESDLAVSDIAIRSGYQNLSNFNRRFRALKGVSPREYRAMLAVRRTRADPA